MNVTKEACCGGAAAVDQNELEQINRFSQAVEIECNVIIYGYIKNIFKKIRNGSSISQR